MATFTDRHIVNALMAEGFDSDGAGRPIPVLRVVEYRTPEGDTCWGVVYEGEVIHRYNAPSPYVLDPVTIWDRCQVCGRPGPTRTHPCRFEVSCSCWTRQMPCDGSGKVGR